MRRLTARGRSWARRGRLRFGKLPAVARLAILVAGSAGPAVGDHHTPHHVAENIRESDFFGSCSLEINDDVCVRDLVVHERPLIGNYELPPNHRNWMKWLPDDVNIAELSIPGTHDAMADELNLSYSQAYCSFPAAAVGKDYARAQDASLREQLDAGVRWVDIRTRLVPVQCASGPSDCRTPELITAHGPCATGSGDGFSRQSVDLLGRDVFDVVGQFLQDNPSETILLQVSNEPGPNPDPPYTDGEFVAEFKRLLSSRQHLFWLGPAGNICGATEPDSCRLDVCYNIDSDRKKAPVLGDGVRGKIVLIPGNVPGTFKGQVKTDLCYLEYDPGILVTQDEYNLAEFYRTGVCPVLDGNDEDSPSLHHCKAGIIARYFQLFDATNPQGDRLLRRNFASATIPVDDESFPFPLSVTPRNVAENVLPGVAAELLLGKHKFTGIVPMDFPGPALIDLIIAHNLRLVNLPDVPGFTGGGCPSDGSPFSVLCREQGDFHTLVQSTQILLEAARDFDLCDDDFEADDGPGACSHVAENIDRLWSHLVPSQAWHVIVRETERNRFHLSIEHSGLFRQGDPNIGINGLVRVVYSLRYPKPLTGLVPKEVLNTTLMDIIRDGHKNASAIRQQLALRHPGGAWTVLKVCLPRDDDTQDPHCEGLPGDGECDRLAWVYTSPDIDGRFLLQNPPWLECREKGANCVEGGVASCAPLGQRFRLDVWGYGPNQPPVADAGGPYDGPEGTPVTLDFTGSYDPEGDALEYQWQETGGLSSTWSPSATAQLPQRIWQDDYPETIFKLQVRDTQGAVGTDETTVTVENESPLVAVPTTSPATSDEGSPVVASATFTDPAFGVVTETFTCTVDYGDGDGPVAGVVSGASCLGPAHVYADNGVYTVTVTVADDDGGVGSSSSTHAVDNVAPVITATVNSAALCGATPEGSPVEVSADFSDPGFDKAAAGTLEDFSSTIDWGDGTLEPATVAEVPGGVGAATTGRASGSHVYDTGGIYTITITIIDDDGGVDLATHTALVTGVGLTPEGLLGVVGTDLRDSVRIKVKKGKFEVRARTPDSSLDDDSEWDSDDDSEGDSDSGSDSDCDSDGDSDSEFPVVRHPVADVVSIEVRVCGDRDKVCIHKSVTVPAILDGGSGGDVLRGGDGPSTLLGGPDRDHLFCGNVDSVADGGDGDDHLKGGDGNDRLLGREGADKLFGKKGDDLLDGGPGADFCNGGQGTNVLLNCDETCDGPWSIELENLIIAGTEFHHACESVSATTVEVTGDATFMARTIILGEGFSVGFGGLLTVEIEQ